MSANASDAGAGAGAGAGGQQQLPPLLPFEQEIVAHAILCLVGFLLFLPLGSLTARYLRTFSPKWLAFHWVFQLVIAGPVIIAGVGLGIHVTHISPDPKVDNAHKILGIILFSLYVIQFILGGVTYSSIGTRSGLVLRRLPQNYVHPILGLVIIGLAFIQVRLGYSTEWPAAVLPGRVDVTKAADIVWYFWLALLPVSYLLGLSMLPKQLKQESRKSISLSSNSPPVYIPTGDYETDIVAMQEKYRR